MTDLKNALRKLHIDIGDAQLAQFEEYYGMLTAANRTLNLTAVTDRALVDQKHFIDSVALVNYIRPDNAPFGLIDVGSGAGFPGIPLKIAFPGLKVTLLDSRGKRVGFLHDVITELGLTDIEAVHGRAEDISRLPAYREQYDICVSRAVASLSVLAEYCLPFVKQDGVFIAYKTASGDEVAKARHAIETMGGRFERQIAFTLPESDIQRTLVGVKKSGRTPAQYPRRAGMPMKKPL